MTNYCFLCQRYVELEENIPIDCFNVRASYMCINDIARVRLVLKSLVHLKFKAKPSNKSREGGCHYICVCACVSHVFDTNAFACGSSGNAKIIGFYKISVSQTCDFCLGVKWSQSN